MLEDEKKTEEQWEDELPEEELSEETEEQEDDDELYEKYIEIMNQEDEEEEDIAAVAERITGERHSRVTTAAPLRIRVPGEAREEPDPVAPLILPEEPTEPEPPEQPDYLELPRRKIEPEVPAAEEEIAEEKPITGRNIFLKKGVAPAVAAVMAILLIGIATAVTVNMVQNRREQDELEQEQNDFPLNTVLGTAEEETDDPAETEEPETEPPAEETEPPETEPETEPETAAPPEPETEPETEPAPLPPPTYSVTLDFYDRDDIKTTVTQMTLAEVYAAVGYTPRESDRPSVGMDYVIAADAYISIDTAEYKSVRVKEVLPYGSEAIELDTIPRGEVNYISEGVNGELEKTYTVEYINGAEVKRTLASEKTTKWPVNEKYEIGVGGTFVGADGITYTYSHRRVVPATYYNIEGLTYLGTNADESVIAVDPETIPLGTRLYVKNAAYDFGVRIASDTGPKVEAWQIDIWLPTSNPQYASFAQIGYHYDMEIYYID